jgi:hypothetical protein
MAMAGVHGGSGAKERLMLVAELRMLRCCWQVCWLLAAAAAAACQVADVAGQAANAAAVAAAASSSAPAHCSCFATSLRVSWLH